MLPTLIQRYYNAAHNGDVTVTNWGTGSDVTIKEIAETIARVVGFTGTTEWDTSKPDGTPQKRLDVSKLADAGWTYSIGLEEGLQSTVAWFEENIDQLRVTGH